MAPVKSSVMTISQATAFTQNASAMFGNNPVQQDDKTPSNEDDKARNHRASGSLSATTTAANGPPQRSHQDEPAKSTDHKQTETHSHGDHTRPIENTRKAAVTDETSYTDFDVLCEKGGRANQHMGNRVFLRVIQRNKEHYRALSKKQDKDKLIQSILLAIQQNGGRFRQRVGPASSEWQTVPWERAYQKVRQALREPDNKVHKTAVAANEAAVADTTTTSSPAPVAAPPPARPSPPPKPPSAVPSSSSHNIGNPRRRSLLDEDDSDDSGDDVERETTTTTRRRTCATAVHRRGPVITTAPHALTCWGDDLRFCRSVGMVTAALCATNACPEYVCFTVSNAPRLDR